MFDYTNTILQDGEYHFRAIAEDSFYNISPEPLEPYVVVVDGTPPTAPVGLQAPENPTADTTPNVSWEASTDETSGVEKYEIVFHDSAWNFIDTPRYELESSDTVLDDSEFSEPLEAGEWYWYVRAVDVAGNVGEWTPTTGEHQTITVGLLPNLVPYRPSGWSDIIVVSTNPDDHLDASPIFSDQDIYIDWAVGNNGDAPTTVEYIVRLYVDDVFADFVMPVPQNVGRWAGAVGSRVSGLTPGQHVIKIEVDPTELVDELDETDNTYSRTIEVKLRGDVNGDFTVGYADLDIIRGNWGQSVEPGCGGDLSGDGQVGYADLDIIRANWGAGIPTAAGTRSEFQDTTPTSTTPPLIGPRRAPASDAAFSSWGNVKSRPGLPLSDADLASLAQAAWLREVEGLKGKGKTRSAVRESGAAWWSMWE